MNKLAIVFAWLGFFLTFSSQAAQFNMASSVTELPINQTFNVDVRLNANNSGNQDIVLADAVIEYEEEMLELLNVSLSSGDTSDFYYAYNLTNNTFPIITSNNETPLSRTQIVVGVPGSQAITNANTNALVAQLQFRAKQPPASRGDYTTTIRFVSNESKVIANDGLGTNIMSGAVGLVLSLVESSSSGSDEDIPFLPVWAYFILAALLGWAYRYRNAR